jgi:carbonic anhydrase
MHKLLRGVSQFQRSVYGAQPERYARLAAGQKPETLLVTCSDSRIQPDVLMQTEPGDLFVLRNAGNIVPRHGESGGEEATVEFAVAGLGVRRIVVCGHSFCGAMQGLLHPEELDALPSVKQWLRHAEPVRQIVRAKYGEQPPEQLLLAAAQANVLVQVENLKTHPAVAAALARDELSLHGWLYRFETGEVLAYHATSGGFVPLDDAHTGAVAGAP